MKQKLDDVIIEAIERDGPGTVRQIMDRISDRVRDRLEHLHNENRVTKKGLGGPGREYVFGLHQEPVYRRF